MAALTYELVPVTSESDLARLSLAAAPGFVGGKGAERLFKLGERSIGTVRLDDFGDVG